METHFRRAPSVRCSPIGIDRRDFVDYSPVDPPPLPDHRSHFICSVQRGDSIGQGVCHTCPSKAVRRQSRLGILRRNSALKNEVPDGTESSIDSTSDSVCTVGSQNTSVDLNYHLADSLYRKRNEKSARIQNLKAELLRLLHEEWTLTGLTPDGYDDIRLQLGCDIPLLKDTSYPIPNSLLQRANTISHTTSWLPLKFRENFSTPTSQSMGPNDRHLKSATCSNSTQINPVHDENVTLRSATNSSTLAPLPSHVELPTRRDWFVKPISPLKQTTMESFPRCSQETAVVDSTRHNQPDIVKSGSPLLELFEDDKSSNTGSIDPTQPPEDDETIDIERASAQLQLRHLEVDYAVISHLYSVHKQKAAETKHEAYKVAYKNYFRKLKELSEQITTLKALLDGENHSRVDALDVKPTRKTVYPQPRKSWGFFHKPRHCNIPTSSFGLVVSDSSRPSSQFEATPIAVARHLLPCPSSPRVPPSSPASRVCFDFEDYSSASVISQQKNHPTTRRSSLMPLFRLFRHERHTQRKTTSKRQKIIDQSVSQVKINRDKKSGSLSSITEHLKSKNIERHAMEYADDKSGCLSKSGFTRETTNNQLPLISVFSFDQKHDRNAQGVPEALWEPFHSENDRCSAGQTLPRRFHSRLSHKLISLSRSVPIDMPHVGVVNGSARATDHQVRIPLRCNSSPLLNNPLNFRSSNEPVVTGVSCACFRPIHQFNDRLLPNPVLNDHISTSTSTFHRALGASILSAAATSLPACSHHGPRNHVTSSTTSSSNWSTSGCSCLSSLTTESSTPNESKQTDSHRLAYNASLKQAPSDFVIVDSTHPASSNLGAQKAQIGRMNPQCMVTSTSREIGCMCSCSGEAKCQRTPATEFCSSCNGFQSSEHLAVHKGDLDEGISCYSDIEFDAYDEELAVKPPRSSQSTDSCETTLACSPHRKDFNSSPCSINPKGDVGTHCDMYVSRNKASRSDFRRLSVKTLSLLRRAVNRASSKRISPNHELSVVCTPRNERLAEPKLLHPLLTKKYANMRNIQREEDLGIVLTKSSPPVGTTNRPGIYWSHKMRYSSRRLPK